MNRRYRIAFFTKSKGRTFYTTYILRALTRCGCDVRRVNMGALRRKVGAQWAARWTPQRITRFAPDPNYTGEELERCLTELGFIVRRTPSNRHLNYGLLHAWRE